MAIILFDKDHLIQVNETADQIRAAIRGASTEPIIQLARASSGSNDPIWINLQLIRVIEDR
jgi:hypothetical protein